jgi:carbonic anhydrase/acetyltransferase-like protein (isoleucine patch superfamily)
MPTAIYESKNEEWVQDVKNLNELISLPLKVKKAWLHNGEEFIRHPNGYGWKGANTKVDDIAFIDVNALVYDYAELLDYSKVLSWGRVFDNAAVSGHVMVYGNAKVFGCSKLKDNVRVYGNASVQDTEMRDNTFAYGRSKLYKCLLQNFAHVRGDAEVTESSLADFAKIEGDAKVDHCVIHGTALIKGGEIENLVIGKGVLFGTVDEIDDLSPITVDNGKILIGNKKLRENPIKRISPIEKQS